MLTLSDTENNLHFILIARGLLEPGAGGEGGHRHPVGPGTAPWGCIGLGGGVCMACVWLGMHGWAQGGYRDCAWHGGIEV